MWQADSVIALLGKLDVERLPPHEGRAVGEVQAKAVDEWLAAYIDLREGEPGRRERPPLRGHAQLLSGFSRSDVSSSLAPLAPLDPASGHVVSHR
jgi:hypothetical protein